MYPPEFSRGGEVEVCVFEVEAHAGVGCRVGGGVLQGGVGRLGFARGVREGGSGGGGGGSAGGLGEALARVWAGPERWRRGSVRSAQKDAIWARVIARLVVLLVC